MARQGRYSKKRTRLDRLRWSVKRRWRWFMGLSRPKKLALLSAPVLAFLILTPIFTYIYFYNDIANQDRLMNANNTGVVLLDTNDKVLYSSGRAQHQKLVPLNKIAPITQKALIASEDKDFYEHSGFSFFSILRSIYSNILAGSATSYGGSTLTQQLAKNTLLTKNKTFLRKYQELTIAMAIEQRYSKDEILDMYLNSVFFGGNVFGIDDAAKYYFGKDASELDLAESAMLIGILPAPNQYSPLFGNPTYAKERQTTVLTRMVDNGYITKEQKEAALKQKLHYVKHGSGINNVAPHFTQMVLDELYEKYGEEKVNRSGYQVKTTLDIGLQKAANKSVSDGMPHIEANGGSNASLVALDPRNGEVRALVGSRDYDNERFGQVNMATTKRQPGSTFKTIYYSDALAKGIITPATVIADVPTDFNGYKPKNFDNSFRGNVTVRQALNWSLNIPSVKIMQKLGISEAVDQAQRYGITTLDEASSYGLSLALGSAEVPLTEMTGAYAAIANGGEHHSMKLFSAIEDKFSKTIYVTDKESKRAISPQGAYLTSNILSDNATRGAVIGDALNVYGPDYKVKTAAVKTGTTDDARDAWTIGYTPSITVGVWVGNNDNKPMLSGGYDMAGPIWREMMQAAIGTSDPAFPRPDGIVQATICNATGIHTDMFLTGSVPESTCSTTPPKKTPKAKPEDKPTPPVKDDSDAGRDNGGTTPPPDDDSQPGDNDGDVGGTDSGEGDGGSDDGSSDGGGGTDTGTGTGSTPSTPPTKPTTP